MTIEVPGEAVREGARQARLCLGAAMTGLTSIATAADERTEEVLLQAASGRLSAVFQKLASATEDGSAAPGGLADGMTALADRFGGTDRDLARAAGGGDAGRSGG